MVLATWPITPIMYHSTPLWIGAGEAVAATAAAVAVAVAEGRSRRPQSRLSPLQVTMYPMHMCPMHMCPMHMCPMHMCGGPEVSLQAAIVTKLK